MLISSIIPVYNAEKTLHRCLDSIVIQNLSELEIILVDDGSTDGSATICDKYASLYPQIKAIHKSNGGVSSARNLGLDNARGPWITFVDSDDEVTSEWAERITGTVAEFCDKSDTLLIGDVYVVHSDGHRNQVFSKAGFNSFRDIFEADLAGAVWNKIFKKEIIDKYAIRFNENLKFSEDCLFVATYSALMNNFYVLKDPIYIQYLPASYSRKYNQYMNLDSQLSLYKKIKAVNLTYSRCMVDGLFMTLISEIDTKSKPDIIIAIKKFKETIGEDIRFVKGRKKLIVRQLAHTGSNCIWYCAIKSFASIK